MILSAGRGKRLYPYTEEHPKPLIPINGKPLLKHTIETLKKAGVEDFIIVTGYLAKAIQRCFGDGSELHVKIQYVYNPLYTLGNAISLKAAEALLREDEFFLLSMADHLIDVNIPKRALRSLTRHPLLCVDREPLYLRRIEEATKVLVDAENYVKGIGKDIPQWNGIDTGVFLLDHTIFKVINKLKKKVNPLTLSHCLKQLIKGHPLWACDVSGTFWIDMDTWEDLALAQRRHNP
ncbi:MAG: sugar phosphate nucleotidyltransferase [Candidatus Bathyarchaeia archaeon]